jgi:hypothetical protein
MYMPSFVLYVYVCEIRYTQTQKQKMDKFWTAGFQVHTHSSINLVGDGNGVHHHRLDRLVVAISVHTLDVVHNVHAAYNLAENRVLGWGGLVKPVEE